MKTELIEYSEKKIEENNIILNELAKREETLAYEERVLINEISSIKNDIRLWKANQRNPDEDLLLLIRELNHTLCGRDNISKTKGKFKIIQEVADETIETLKQIEMKINEQLSQLTVYEDDFASFYNIVNQRKVYNKELKQSEAKKYLVHLHNLKRERAQEKFNRIIIQSRKTEAPFFPHKKNKQNSVVNTLQSQQLNDDDLLNYN